MSKSGRPQNSKSRARGIVTHLGTFLLGGISTWYGGEYKDLCNHIESNKYKIEVAHAEIDSCLGGLHARLDSIDVRLAQLKCLGKISAKEFEDFTYRCKEISGEISKLKNFFQINNTSYHSPFISFLSLGKLRRMNEVMAARYRQDRAATKGVVDTTNSKANQIINSLTILQEKKFRHRDEKIDSLKTDFSKFKALLTKIEGTIDLAANTKNQGVIETGDKTRSLGDRSAPRMKTTIGPVFVLADTLETPQSDEFIDGTDLRIAQNNHEFDNSVASNPNDFNSPRVEIVTQADIPTKDYDSSVRSDYKRLGEAFEPERIEIEKRIGARRLKVESQIRSIEEEIKNLQSKLDYAEARSHENKAFWETLTWRSVR